MNSLNDWRNIVLTDTMADLVQEFNKNSDNGLLLDRIMNFVVNTGVFRTGDEKVNTTQIGPHVNVTIPSVNLNSIMFSGFKFYFGSVHKIFDSAVTVDLSNYNDGMTHLLYLKCEVTVDETHNITQYRLVPVIMDEKYEGEQDLLILARFVITQSAVQFYVITKNAGTNPFDSFGAKYKVLTGLQPVASGDLELSITDGIIKYSGININNTRETDILVEELDGMTMPIKYIETDNTVDWTTSSESDVITDKVLNYNTGVLSTVPANKFSCQKVYYDYCSRTFIIQYGQIVYDTFNEALAGASNFNYAEPDMENLYIPVAVMIIKSGDTDLSTSSDFKVLDITDASSLSSATAVDPVAQQLANTALSTAQNAQSDATQAISDAADAQEDATQALSDSADAQSSADDANSKIDAHLLDTNNPHNLTKSSIGLGSVDNTADLNKPLSNPQKQYIDGQVDDLNVEINKKASNATQTKCVVKSTQPTSDDYGRNPIKGDLWLIP